MIDIAKRLADILKVSLDYLAGSTEQAIDKSTLNKLMSTQHVQLSIPLSFNQVVDIVKQLSPSEKQQLSEVLWTEQNIDDIVIPEKYKQIVRERIKKYENSPGSYLSWNDVERTGCIK